MKKGRISRISNLFHYSAWRFLALVVTDPQNDILFRELRKDTIERQLGDPIPWLASNCSDYLDEIVQSGMCVLEWGCGASSIWFSKKGCNIISIEHDE